MSSAVSPTKTRSRAVAALVVGTARGAFGERHSESALSDCLQSHPTTCSFQAWGWYLRADRDPHTHPRGSQWRRMVAASGLCDVSEMDGGKAVLWGWCVSMWGTGGALHGPLTVLPAGHLICRLTSCLIPEHQQMWTFYTPKREASFSCRNRWGTPTGCSVVPRVHVSGFITH